MPEDKDRKGGLVPTDYPGNKCYPILERVGKAPGRGRDLEQCPSHTSTEAHLKHEAHGEGPTPEQIKQWLDMAYATFKSLKGQQDQRDTWPGELIVAQAEAKGCQRSQLWKKVRATEKIRKVTWMVKRTLRPHDEHRGLMQVTEPYNGRWPRATHTTKARVEQACLEEAGRRFTQANRTPFLQSPLLEDFGEIRVDHPAFRAVLAGTYVAPPGCTPTTIKLLKQLCRPPEVSEIKLGGEEEFTTEWRKAREQTASSPSKVHFGHYIAGTFNPKIAIINAKMADWPQRKGRPLRRWTKGLNVMLEKYQETATWRSYALSSYLRLISITTTNALVGQSWCLQKKQAYLPKSNTAAEKTNWPTYNV